MPLQAVFLEYTIKSCIALELINDSVNSGKVLVDFALVQSNSMRLKSWRRRLAQDVSSEHRDLAFNA